MINIPTRDEAILNIDWMISMRTPPSIEHLKGWKEVLMASAVIPEFLPLHAYEAAESAYRDAERIDAEQDPLEAAIKAYLNAVQGPAPVVLKPCPFCQKPLTRREGINPIARCDTPKCWVEARKIGVPIDDPEQVRSWNNRGDEPA